MDKDDPFRKRTVKAWLIAGSAVRKLDKVRPWIQDECHKSLTHSSHLSRKFIPQLLKEENDLKKEELKDAEKLGIMFDATPFRGDFFAVVARFVVVDPSEKKAKAVQRLIHGANVEGSMNQHTIAGEVTEGLMSVGKTHYDAVVGINDGC